jgi:hypothetical protein
MVSAQDNQVFLNSEKRTLATLERTLTEKPNSVSFQV